MKKGSRTISRTPTATAGEKEIISVIQWADKQGFRNIFAALHRALALISYERASLQKEKAKH
jgi:hypothetical protein